VAGNNKALAEQMLMLIGARIPLDAAPILLRGRGLRILLGDEGGGQERADRVPLAVDCSLGGFAHAHSIAADARTLGMTLGRLSLPEGLYQANIDEESYADCGMPDLIG
jgi:hypothetical protein